MPKKKDKRKVAIYSRKSKFTGKGESIENQILQCKQEIKRKYPDIKDDDILIYEDEGYSGGNTNRPQFQKMIQDCKNHLIKALVCYRLDRVSRSVNDFVSLMDNYLKVLDVAFISVCEEFKTDTPMGKCMMMICSVFAQLERETIAERIRDNMTALAKTGRWLGGTTPTGYESVKIPASYTIDGKVRSMYKLTVIEEEKKIVEIIRDKFLETNSLSKVETYLIQNDIKTKTGKIFTRLAVKDILQNPVYMTADEVAWNYFENSGLEISTPKESFDGKHGIMAYNKTTQNKGTHTQKNDMSQWIVAVGKHVPIISSHDWIKIQKMIEQNKPKSYRQERSNLALLSGLVRCGDCGSYMRPKTARGETDKGEKKFYYLCQMKENSRGKNCAIKNPPGNLLDEFVCNEVKKLGEDNSELIHQLNEAKKSISSASFIKEDEIKTMEKQLKEYDREINNRINTLSKCEGTVASSYLIKQIEEFDKKSKEVFAKIEDLKKQREAREIYDNQFDIVKDTLISFSKSFDTMSMEHKRNALRLIIEEIVWDGENVHIYFFGSRAEESQSDATTVGLQMNSS